MVISKKIYRAKVLKRFAENDVAILQILTNKPLPCIKLGIPNEILLGNFNFTVGYPAIEIFGTNPKFYHSAVRIDPLLKDIQGLLSYKIEKSSDSEVKPNQKVFQKVVRSSAIVLNCKKDG